MKKLFALVLALCLIAGMLPMAAMAEAAAVSVKFTSSTASSVTVKVEPGDTAYVTTDDEKQFVKWTDEAAPADKFVKMELSADGATLNVTLNNIDADSSKSGYHEHGIEFKAGDYAVVLNLVGANKITEQNSACIKYLSANGMTITGSGSLDLTCTGAAAGALWASGGDLLIQDTTLNLAVTKDISGLYNAILSSCGNVTIKGSKVTSNTMGGAFVFFGTPDLKIGRYTQDSDTNRKLVIENSEITAKKTKGHTIFNTAAPATIINSTLECTVYSAPVFGKTPILEGDFIAMAGAKESKAKEYLTSNKSLWNSAKYMKLYPGKSTLTDTPEETNPAETTPVETTPVETTPVETTKPVETTPVETTKPVEETKPVETTAPVEDNKNDDATEEKSGSPLKIVLIVLVALVVLGGGAVAVILILRNKNAEYEEDEEDEEEEEEAEESEEETEE